jgi:hypothetical protein
MGLSPAHHSWIAPCPIDPSGLPAREENQLPSFRQRMRQSVQKPAGTLLARFY